MPSHPDGTALRHKPASGVHITSGEPTIVFVTVCSAKRQPWIAQPPVHEILTQTWREADAWLVGHYQLMPDHLHFFVAPHHLEIPLNRWMTYWKRTFTQKLKHLPDTIQNSTDWKWQTGHWDTRLRRSENYTEKWNYIRENPVKAGLAIRPEDWPYQGTINPLRW